MQDPVPPPTFIVFAEILSTSMVVSWIWEPDIDYIVAVEVGWSNIQSCKSNSRGQPPVRKKLRWPSGIQQLR